MRIGTAHRANTETFLVHIFGRGLDDERYVVEKYRSLAGGQIRPVQCELVSRQRATPGPAGWCRWWSKLLPAERPPDPAALETFAGLL